MVGADATSLLVGEVEHIFTGMKTEMPRAEWLLGDHLRRCVERQVARLFIESELPDLVRPSSGDMRDKGKAVGRVRLNGMRSTPGLSPLNRRVADGPVVANRMH